MAILVAGWTSVWTGNTIKSIEERFGCAEVVPVHSKNCQRQMSLFTQCIMRETGEVRVLEEQIQHSSLTRAVFEQIMTRSTFNLFILSTDFGFRSVSECIRAIRIFPQYRFTPTIIHSTGELKELTAVQRLGITAMYSGDDISPIAGILSALDDSGGVRT
ncbi:MAG: hypothetical protein AAB783_00360 [Patescibacteria group bacterium]